MSEKQEALEALARAQWRLALTEGERFFLSSFKLPDKLTFAGQTIPLDNWQVRERFEYEFYQFLEDQGESIILAKRTGRCFPPAEKQLAEAGLPDELKYMLLVESKCIAAAYSKAKASGPWQFIPSTGRRYHLKSDAVRDERRSLEMSTEAAIKYLKYLKEFQQNDWFLAMASYNAGEEWVRKLLKEQKITDYWKMHGPRETMRYWLATRRREAPICAKAANVFCLTLSCRSRASRFRSLITASS